jgi:hypothetical protein
MPDENSQNAISINPFSGFWELLKNGYEKLPEPFKVLAFFLMLLISIYVLVSPKTVGGSIKFIDKFNMERNLSGQTIRIYVSPSYFPYQTQSRGDFIIPVVNSFGGISFKIDNPNDSQREVTGKISLAEVWRSYLGGNPLTIKIEIILQRCLLVF